MTLPKISSHFSFSFSLYRSISLPPLPPPQTTAEQMFAEKKTPLFIVEKAEYAQRVVEQVRDKGGVVLDTRPLVLPLRQTGIKFPDAVEGARASVVRAMKGGVPLLVDLQEKPPEFVSNIAGNAKYKDALPLALFDASDRCVHVEEREERGERKWGREKCCNRQFHSISCVLL